MTQECPAGFLLARTYLNLSKMVYIFFFVDHHTCGKDKDLNHL